MDARRIAFAAVIAVTVTCPPGLTRGQAEETGAGAAFSATTIAREHRYLVNARVRPLLFWISKSNIGDARIAWRTGPDGTIGYELLVGSDPARTPRRINRWGYLREESGPHGATVFGVMSKSDERGIDEADRNTSGPGHGVGVFKALRQHITGSQTHLTISDVRMPEHLTYADLGALLAAVPGAPSRSRSATVAGWTSPGFLAATASLLAQARTATGPSSGTRCARVYPYNGRLYELHLRSVQLRGHFVRDGRDFGPAVHSHFNVHNLATGEDTPFTIVSGAWGELADVPLFLSFRPRWWLEIECVLDDQGRESRQDLRR